jgi:8-oxo-dGTP diphosphatase
VTVPSKYTQRERDDRRGGNAAVMQSVNVAGRLRGRAAKVIIVEEWTGESACVLQAAYRATNEAFAHGLGIAVRTVAAWHDRPELVPRTDVQQILDVKLERAPEAVAERFARLLEAVRADTKPASQALAVAIAVVLRDQQVLLVCRRAEGDGGLLWQFPAGVIKPGGHAEKVAVRETLAETGVHCAVKGALGSRVHPVTGVLCEYLFCDYLTGEARNADTLENLDVAWAPVADLAKFIPVGNIYGPVLAALEGRSDD